MKLIFLFFLGFLNLSLEKQCEIYNYISKTSYVTSYSNGRGVYIDTYDFDGDDYIGIYVTVYNGYFQEYGIYYDDDNTSPTKGTTLDLNKYESSYASSYSNSYYSSYYHHYIYDSYTSYFKISKPSNRYLIIAIPDFYGSSVEIGYSNGFPVWAIVLIVIVVVIIIVGVIIGIIFYIRRKARNAYISPPVNPGYYPPTGAYANTSPGYIAPPAYPPAAPTYY